MSVDINLCNTVATLRTRCLDYYYYVVVSWASIAKFTVLLSRSPGFGLTLVAESTTGVMHGAESSTYSWTTPNSVATRGAEDRGQMEEPILPEDVGKRTASLLLEEIVKVAISNRIDDPII